MTRKSIGEDQQKELSWEEAVARFLEDNPDFFENHPDALAKLSLVHDVDGKAISLIERQVLVLREQGLGLQRQLRELVSIARENEVLGNRLHRYALVVLDGHSTDEVLSGTYELLRQEFKLDAVRILMPEDAAGHGEFVRMDGRRLETILKQFNSGKPVCGGKFDDNLMRVLFGDLAEETRSSALIPLSLKAHRGVLCLGSRDPHRFHPGMATTYLVKLSEILTHGLARHMK